MRLLYKKNILSDGIFKFNLSKNLVFSSLYSVVFSFMEQILDEVGRSHE